MIGGKTRLALYGGPGAAYGGFTAKTETVTLIADNDITYSVPRAWSTYAEPRTWSTYATPRSWKSQPEA